MEHPHIHMHMHYTAKCLKNMLTNKRKRKYHIQACYRY